MVDMDDHCFSFSRIRLGVYHCIDKGSERTGWHHGCVHRKALLRCKRAWEWDAQPYKTSYITGIILLSPLAPASVEERASSWIATRREVEEGAILSKITTLG